MSRDLHDLLTDATPVRAGTPDLDRIETRVTRRRAGRAGAAAVVLAAMTFSLGSVVTGPDVPFVDEGPDASPTWERITDAPLVGRERPVTDVDGDRVVLWGGASGNDSLDRTDAAGTFHETIELGDGAVYNRTTDSWEPLPATAQLGVRSFPHVRLVGDTVLVWGGTAAEPVGSGGARPLGDRPALLDGAVYDLTAERWEYVPQAPLSSRHPAAVDWDGEQLLVWGSQGDDDLGVAGDGAIWTAAEGWRTMTPFPLEPRFGSAIAWDADRLVVWGGATGFAEDREPSPELADGAVYDRATNSWQVLPEVDLPPGWFSSAHGRPNTQLDGDRFLVAGGAVTTPSTVHDLRGAVLDLSTGTWTAISDGPASASHVATDVHGAYAVDDGVAQTTWVHEAATDSWWRAELGSPWDVRAAVGQWQVFVGHGVDDLTADRRWEPVGLATLDGRVVRPTLDDRDDIRHFYSVIPMESGALLWGGMGFDVSDEGGYSDGEWLATGWFLPLD